MLGFGRESIGVVCGTWKGLMVATTTMTTTTHAHGGSSGRAGSKERVLIEGDGPSGFVMVRVVSVLKTCGKE